MPEFLGVAPFLNKIMEAASNTKTLCAFPVERFSKRRPERQAERDVSRRLGWLAPPADCYRESNGLFRHDGRLVRRNFSRDILQRTNTLLVRGYFVAFGQTSERMLSKGGRHIWEASGRHIQEASCMHRRQIQGCRH